ncbi:MAG: ABC transporter permease [Deltaproteobacteria bacterium]|nr:ABC transporter permease [Deltaproteobacteria bacterium]
MKSFERLTYFIATTVKGIKTNLYLNAITIITIAVAFFILNIFFIIYNNVNSVLGEWKGRIRIIAYLQDGLSGGELTSLENRIKNTSGIKSIKYYSKQDALSQFREELKGQAGILNGVSADVLPAYLTITVQESVLNNNSIDKLAAAIKRVPGVSDVQYGAQIAQKVSGILILVKMLGIGIGGFMLFAIFIIVSNTIRISIFSRKDEIEIMKLVGATNLFIEIPFMLEGMIQVLAGTGISIVFLYLVYRLFLYRLHTTLGSLFLTMNVSFLSSNAILALLAGSALMGMTGAIISTGKFIRRNY